MECKNWQSILEIIHVVICSLLSLSVSYGLFIFWRDTKNVQISKFSRNIGLIFIISSMVSLPLMPFGSLQVDRCLGVSQSLEHALSITHLIFAVIHWTVMPLIFYTKTRLIFNGTQFALSKINRYTFNILYVTVLALILVTAVLIINGISNLITVYFYAFWAVSYIALYSILTVTMVRKLIQVYQTFINLVNMDKNKCQDMKNKDITENTEFLLHSITKTTVLNSIQLIITFTRLVLTVLYVIKGYNLMIRTIMLYIFVMDNYSNWLCTILCYNTFKMVYDTNCGCIHSECNKCLMKIITKRKHNEIIMTEIHTDQK